MQLKRCFSNALGHQRISSPLSLPLLSLPLQHLELDQHTQLLNLNHLAVLSSRIASIFQPPYHNIPMKIPLRINGLYRALPTLNLHPLNIIRFKTTKRLAQPLKVLPQYNLNRETGHISKLINDDKARGSLLSQIKSQKLSVKDEISTYTLFYNILDHVTAESDYDDVDSQFLLACEIWHAAFATSVNEQLQKRLASKRDIFVHSMMNLRQFDAYQSLIEPLLGHHSLINLEWCDTLASTLEFSFDKSGSTTHNHLSVMKFLNGTNDKLEKRTLLSVFIRTTLRNSEGFEDEMVAQFLKYVDKLENGDFNLDPLYDKALVNIIKHYCQDDGGIGRLEELFRQTFVNVANSRVSDFLSSLIKVSSDKSPFYTHRIWNFKWVNRSIYPLSSKDLTYTMHGLWKTRQYDTVVAISKNNSDLYHEDQLGYLLRVSEAKSDWKTLQSQFEAMYGQGQLPYAIHYSIVMNAVAPTGAQNDIDRLYAQMQKRNIQPTPSIYAAIIRCHITNRNFELAKVTFERYLEDAPSMSDHDLTASQLYQLLFKVHLSSSNKRDVLDFFEKSIDRQRQENVVILDDSIIIDIINYLSEEYALKDLRYIEDYCRKNGLLTEGVYIALIKAYIRFNQHEIAEDLITEANHESVTPFTNLALLATQLMNYRIWLKYRTDFKQNFYIHQRRENVLKRIENGNYTEYKVDQLFGELIRLNVSRNLVKDADKYLEESKRIGWLTENQFLPFLKHYSSSDKTDLHQKVILMYREMVESNVQVSVATYSLLMKSVLFLDKHSRKSFHNSQKLLELVLEMYGFKIPGMLSYIQESKLNSATKARLTTVSTVQLCSLVNNFIEQTPSTQTEKAEFMVEFLGQLRERLDGQMKSQVRLSIHKEMSSLYDSIGNLHMAKSLISNGINELNSIISKFIEEYPFAFDYDFQLNIPKRIQIDFSDLMHLYLKILQQERTQPTTFLSLLKTVREKHMKLNGRDYMSLTNKLMEIPEQSLDQILYIVDEHMIDTNLNEQVLFRKLQFLYKVFITEKAEILPKSRLEQLYQMFNEFYEIKDLDKLRIEFQGYSFQLELQETMKYFKTRFSLYRRWNYNYVLSKPELFFAPEIQLSSQDRLPRRLAKRLYYYINRMKGDTNEKLFPLMDKYPNAIDGIFLEHEMAQRFRRFRNYVDKIVAPPRDKLETYRERQHRTNRAIYRTFSHQWAQPHNDLT